MISSLTLCAKHSGRVSGRKHIRFSKEFNSIIGPNGSGKSSLLEAIYTCPDCVHHEESATNYRYFNSEAMNPHRSDKHFRGIQGSIIKVRAMFSSHGETMRDVLRFMKFNAGDCLLLDEPESGHDVEWIVKIKKGFDVICAIGCQVIIATHHPVLFDRGHIIELNRGYRRRVVGIFQKLL